MCGSCAVKGRAPHRDYGTSEASRRGGGKRAGRPAYRRYRRRPTAKDPFELSHCGGPAVCRAIYSQLCGRKGNDFAEYLGVLLS